MCDTSSDANNRLATRKLGPWSPEPCVEHLTCPGAGEGGTHATHLQTIVVELQELQHPARAADATPHRAAARVSAGSPPSGQPCGRPAAVADGCAQGQQARSRGGVADACQAGAGCGHFAAGGPGTRQWSAHVDVAAGGGRGGCASHTLQI